jgi:hypothetical protein
MKLHGSIATNLSAAIDSAKRLRGSPVHNDTLKFWRDLLSCARAEKRALGPDDAAALDPLIAELQSQLAAREQHGRHS